MRHGEAMSNVKGVVSGWPEKFLNPLTKKGKATVREAGKKVKNKNIDLIFSSDLLRTKETAEIVGRILKIKPKYDKRLREIGFGIFNSGPISIFDRYFKYNEQRIKKGAPEGESYSDVSRRIASFFREVNKKHKGKNILIISHQGPLFILEGHIMGFSLLEIIKKFSQDKQLHRGELKELN